MLYVRCVFYFTVGLIYTLATAHPKVTVQIRHTVFIDNEIYKERQLHETYMLGNSVDSTVKF